MQGDAAPLAVASIRLTMVMGICCQFLTCCCERGSKLTHVGNLAMVEKYGISHESS